MATPAQILANRENAQKSTGPTSSEGKANSSLNNLQHGLAARGFIVVPGQESAFEDLEAGYRTNLVPVGPVQESIFLRILEADWNLHRCRLAQAKLYLESADLNVDPILDLQSEAKFNRIQKYARQNENSLRKALAELSKIQTEIQYRHEAFPLSDEQIDDPEIFNQTPHSLSDACQFAKVMDTVAHQRRSGVIAGPPKPLNNKDKEAAFRRAVEFFIAPPTEREKFQFEADPPQGDARAAA